MASSRLVIKYRSISLRFLLKSIKHFHLTARASIKKNDLLVNCTAWNGIRYANLDLLERQSGKKNYFWHFKVNYLSVNIFCLLNTLAEKFCEPTFSERSQNFNFFIPILQRTGNQYLPNSSVSLEMQSTLHRFPSLCTTFQSNVFFKSLISSFVKQMFKSSSKSNLIYVIMQLKYYCKIVLYSFLWV